MHSVAEIVGYMERFAPRSLAADWDNVGLLLGDRVARVGRVLTCLTVTPEVVEEAVAEKAGLIITHHPMLFRGAKRLTTDTTEGGMVMKLLRNEIAVYSPHTAFDNTQGGINDMLAERLGLEGVQPLRKEAGSTPHKLVVFVPESDLEPVSEAMFKAGAGHIGEYSRCSFRLAGTGTFFGSDQANPTVGKKGKLETVEEIRLEVLCPERKLDRILAAMIEAHSYEEPAYDVYPLRSETTPTGRIGFCSSSVELKQLAETVREKLAGGPIQVVGDGGREVRSVAIVCGAGGDMLSDAIRARADVFLTGEMRFHDYLRAEAEDIGLILPGHYATERFALEVLASRLAEEFPELTVTATEREHDPVTWV